MSIQQFLADESGTVSVETCVMLALIIAACIGAVDFLGGETNQLVSNANSAIVNGLN